MPVKIFLSPKISDLKSHAKNARISDQPVCQPVRVDTKSTEEGHDHDADRAIEDVLLCVLRHDIVARD